MRLSLSTGSSCICGRATGHAAGHRTTAAAPAAACQDGARQAAFNKPHAAGVLPTAKTHPEGPPRPDGTGHWAPPVPILGGHDGTSAAFLGIPGW